LAPIPRARVTATVIHNARARVKDRIAIFKSRRKDMSVLDCLGYANVALGAKQIWLIHNRRTASDYRSGKKVAKPKRGKIKTGIFAAWEICCLATGMIFKGTFATTTLQKRGGISHTLRPGLVRTVVLPTLAR
jgi:hypothetical protein